MLPAAQDAPSEDAAWLFVVQGTVTAIDSAGMELAADRNVVAFTDRPARQARLLVLADFVASAWGEGGDFRRDPPNASLIDETTGQIGVITMIDAVLIGGTLGFKFVTIEGTLPKVGDRIALTIDVVTRRSTDASTFRRRVPCGAPFPLPFGTRVGSAMD
jgi:hypothetical protein